MRKDLVRQKCRIKSTLLFYNKTIPKEIDSSKWNERMRNWIWTLELETEEGTKTLRLQMSMLEYIRGRDARLCQTTFLSITKSLRPTL